jgi:hypothetical protein
MTAGTSSPATAASIQAYQASATRCAGPTAPAAARPANQGATPATAATANPKGDSATFSDHGLALLNAAADPADATG